MANKETGATLTTVVGQVFAPNEAGEISTIKSGDILHGGEKIVTSVGARAELDPAKT